MSRTRSFLRPLVLALLGGTAIPVSALAADWQGSGANNWNDGTNWSPNGVPNSPTATANFNGAGGTSVDLDGSFAVNAVSVSTLSYVITASSTANVLTFAGSNPTVDVATGLDLTINSQTSTASVVKKTGDGALTLSDTLSGSVLVSEGTLNLGYDSNGVGGVTGNVALAGTSQLVAANFGSPLTFALGSLTGESGTSVDIQSGVTLQVGSGNYHGTIFDDGALTKAGSGTLILDGPVTLAGPTTVQDTGTLVVNSANYTSPITLDAGTTLAGVGSLTSITSTGATIAPGSAASNAIGTMTAGTVTLDAASTYAVEVQGTTSDKLVVTGTATLGGATVSVTALNDNAQEQHYTILTAGTITGNFNPVVSENIVAFDASLQRTANAVDLVLTRNAVPLVQPGQTGNQGSTAAAIDALGPANPVNAAVAANYMAGQNTIFDQFSGESFASERTILAGQSQSVRDAALDRITQAFAALGDGSGAVSGYAAGPVDTASPTVMPGMWGALSGRMGVVNATGSSAAVNARSGSLLLGTDGLLGDWRLGVMLHAGMSAASEPALNASTSSTDFGAGLYGGAQWGGTHLSFGADYEKHLIGSSRNVTVPGIVQTLSASYGGSTAQAFAELSQDLDLSRLTLTPFADVALVNVSTDAFTESGGSAALSSLARSDTFVFTTLGLRGSVKAAVGEGMLLAVHAGAGWQHVFGATPTAVNAFAGGSSFTVTGAPIAADAARLDAGVSLDVSANLTLGLDYDGEISTAGQTHALKGSVGGKF